MPRILQVTYFSLFDDLIPMIHLDESELKVLWVLAEEGPKCVYELAKRRFSLPELLYDGFWNNANNWKDISKEARKYHYPFIHKTIKKLQEKDLVRTSKDTSRERIRKLVEPTFSGLMLYLQNSASTKRFGKAIGNYPRLLRFSVHWNSICKLLGEEVTLRILEQTVKDFIHLERTLFKTKSLDLKFYGYLESMPPLADEEDEFLVSRKRNTKVARFLESSEATELRNSYIAYLAVHDLKTLSRKGKEEMDELIVDLKSETELAYFERKETGAGSLFRTEKLREYFPDYAEIEHFFTGKFIKNLLWTEKRRERPKTTYEFEAD